MRSHYRHVLHLHRLFRIINHWFVWLWSLPSTNPVSGKRIRENNTKKRKEDGKVEDPGDGRSSALERWWSLKAPLEASYPQGSLLNISIYRIPHSVRNPPLRAIYNSILQLWYWQRRMKKIVSRKKARHCHLWCAISSAWVVTISRIQNLATRKATSHLNKLS